MLDPDVIRQLDFGGGNACSVEEYALLGALVYLHKPASILEIGTSTGIGALVMAAAGNADGGHCRVVSIDIPYGSATFAAGRTANCTAVDRVRAGTSAAIEWVTGSSREVLPQLAAAGRRFDFVLIDGDHTAEGVRADWEHALRLAPDVVVLHDSVHHRSVAALVEALEPTFGGLTLAYPPGWHGTTAIRDVGFAPGVPGGVGNDCPGLTVFTRVSRVAEARARYLREHTPSGHEIAQRLKDRGILDPLLVDRVYEGFGFTQPAAAPEPLAGTGRVLEIVLTGRNDGFGGDDFNERMFTAAAFNHRNLTEAGVAHRFTLVEWNPTPGRPLLADIIEDRLPWWGDCLVVDPAWHAQLSENPRLQFMEFFAKNVAIRRSTADWILTSNTDIFYSREVVERIARVGLRPGTLYRACRIDVDRHIPWHEPSWALFEERRHHLRAHDLEPPFYSNAAGDFLLLDRASYHRLGGFNERVRFAKIYKDGQFCIQARAHGMPIEVIGAIHHLDHDGSFITATEKYGPDHALAPFGPRWDYSHPYVNRPDWGLAAAVADAEPGTSRVWLRTPDTHGVDVSFVLPMRQESPWLEEAVRRLSALPSSVEVIGVRPAADGAPLAGDQRVRVVATAPGSTLARDINEGLAQARGRLLCCLSGPAWPSPEGLARAIEQFANEPGLDALACAYRWALPDGTPLGERQSAEGSPFFVFRRRVYDALDGFDEASATPQQDFWARIAAAMVVDSDASIAFEVWPHAGGAPWIVDSSADAAWATVRHAAPAVRDREPIPGLLVADYARRKQQLHESLRAQLRRQLAADVREIAIWEVDATTPLVVQAAADLGLQVAGIFTRDAALHDAQIGGVPVKPAQAAAVPGGIPVVLTMPPLLDRASLFRLLPASSIVTLVAPSDQTGGVPLAREAWGPLVEARAHRKAGRRSEAVRSFRAAVGLDVAPDVLREAAEAVAEAGDLRLGISLLRRLLRASTDDAQPGVLYQLGSLYKRAGNARQARRFFAQLVDRGDLPAHYAGGARFHLGELALQANQREDAVRLLGAARELLPNHRRAAELLAQLTS